MFYLELIRALKKSKSLVFIYFIDFKMFATKFKVDIFYNSGIILKNDDFKVLFLKSDFLSPTKRGQCILKTSCINIC